MNTPQTQGEVRPTVTSGDPYAEPFAVPLYALRRREWRVISPDECRVTDCPVCAWRRAGLLDHPELPVVRESDPEYWTCRSSYCPGCGAVRCLCPPNGSEDELAEAAFALGYDHGADGPENRPDRRWLVEAGLEALAEMYYEGYDAACASLTWPAEGTAEAPR